MRSAVAAALVGSGLLLSAWLVATDRRSQADPLDVSSIDGQELITFVSPAGDDRQLLLVIDPRTRVLSAYSIGLASGEIELRSVRNLTWDLQLSHFNGVSPLPRDIRAMLEQE
jgi:hypothetical protein